MNQKRIFWLILLFFIASVDVCMIHGLEENHCLLPGQERAVMRDASEALEILRVFELPDTDSLEFSVPEIGDGGKQETALLKDIMAAQQHLTHLLIFSAIDYMTFFNHFISSVEEAGRFGGYDINMDAYAQLRQRNQGKVNKIGVDIGKIGVQAVKAGISRNIGNLFKCVAPTIDILKISEEMMNDTLTPSKSRAWEFLDAMIEHRETYNLSMEDK